MPRFFLEWVPFYFILLWTPNKALDLDSAPMANISFLECIFSDNNVWRMLSPQVFQIAFSVQNKSIFFLFHSTLRKGNSSTNSKSNYFFNQHCRFSQLQNICFHWMTYVYNTDILYFSHWFFLFLRENVILYYCHHSLTCLNVPHTWNELNIDVSRIHIVLYHFISLNFAANILFSSSKTYLVCLEQLVCFCVHVCA